jgi:hypothetical protein
MELGQVRRDAIAAVNEEFGVYSRNAVVREHLAAYDARVEEAYKCMKEGKPNDGNLANNYPPYDKVTRGDVIAGRLGKDQMGGKRKVLEKKTWEEGLDIIDTRTNKMIGSTSKPVDSDVQGSGDVTQDSKPVVSPTAPKVDTSGPSAADKAGLAAKIGAMKEATMTGIKLKNTKKGAHVSYRGREIGKVSPYQHMDSSGKLTGATKWAATDKSGDDIVGSRKKEHAIADLRSMEASRLRDKRSMKEEALDEAKKWIQAAIKKKGALSKQLGVPEKKNIPVSKLKAASDEPGKLGKRARLALTLRKLHKEENQDHE